MYFMNNWKKVLPDLQLNPEFNKTDKNMQNRKQLHKAEKKYNAYK